MNFFEITNQSSDSPARTGLLKLGAQEIATPAFIPDLPSSPKRIFTPEELAFWGANALRVPVWPLLQNPGQAMIARRGGLQGYFDVKSAFFAHVGIEWDHASQEHNSRRVQAAPAGLSFEAAPDWNRIVITPEDFVRAQASLNSQAVELLSPLDLQESFTLDWIERGLSSLQRAFSDPQQRPRAYTPIRFLKERKVNTLADGWVATAADLTSMQLENSIVPIHAKLLSRPMDIVRAVRGGADTFDASFPLASARQKTLHIMPRSGETFRTLWLEDHAIVDSKVPPDTACGCYTCRSFTLADLSHMVRQEPGQLIRLCVIHNMRFTFDLTEKMKRAIKYGSLEEWIKEL